MKPPSINSEGFEVPDKTLVVVPNLGIQKEQISPLLESLDGNFKRDWFTDHFYYCLPLNIGNQYGFIVKAEADFSVYWTGEVGPHGVTVDYGDVRPTVQKYDGHFGSGIVTVQNSWHYRTPPGVNLMTISPPNFIKHGITHMTGVIETDNLQRDFTFNFKITKPGIRINFKAGEPIGAFIPIPRYFADSFSIAFDKDIFSEDVLAEETKANVEYGRLRTYEDVLKNHTAGRLYFKGIDAWGNPYDDHQKR